MAIGDMIAFEVINAQIDKVMREAIVITSQQNEKFREKNVDTSGFTIDSSVSYEEVTEFARKSDQYCSMRLWQWSIVCYALRHKVPIVTNDACMHKMAKKYGCISYSPTECIRIMKERSLAMT